MLASGLDEEARFDVLNELIPPEPSSKRRLLIGGAIVGIASLMASAWGWGLIIPRPFGMQNVDFQGAVTLAADPQSDSVVLAGIILPNYSRIDLQVTGVQVHGLPIDVVDNRWAFEHERQGNDPRRFLVIGQHPLPAEVPPVDHENDDYANLDIYLRPDCKAEWPDPDNPIGEISLRFEFPNRPSWLHNWVTGSNPIWAPGKDPSGNSYSSAGMVGNQALNENDEFLPVVDLKSAMCALADGSQ